MGDAQRELEAAMFVLHRGPTGETRRMRLYVQDIGDYRVAMVVEEHEPAPAPGSLRGVCFFGKTTEAAKEVALRFYERVESIE